MYRLHKIVHQHNPNPAVLALLALALLGIYVSLFVIGVKVWHISDAIDALQTLQQ